MSVKSVKIKKGDEFQPYGKRKAIVTKVKNGMVDYEMACGLVQVTGSMSIELFEECKHRAKAQAKLLKVK